MHKDSVKWVIETADFQKESFLIIFTVPFLGEDMDFYTTVAWGASGYKIKENLSEDTDINASLSGFVIPKLNEYIREYMSTNLKIMINMANSSWQGRGSGSCASKSVCKPVFEIEAEVSTENSDERETDLTSDPAKEYEDLPDLSDVTIDGSKVSFLYRVGISENKFNKVMSGDYDAGSDKDRDIIKRIALVSKNVNGHVGMLTINPKFKRSTMDNICADFGFTKKDIIGMKKSHIKRASLIKSLEYLVIFSRREETFKAMVAHIIGINPKITIIDSRDGETYAVRYSEENKSLIFTA